MKHFYLEKFVRNTGIPVSIRNSPQGEITEPHDHDYIEVVFVYAGHAIHQLHDASGKKVLSNAVIKGDVFTVLPGEIHSYCESCSFRIYNLCIGHEFLKTFSNDLIDLEYYELFFNPERGIRINQLHLPPMDFIAVEDIIKKISLTLHLRPERKSRMLMIRTLLQSLLIAVFDGISKGWKQYPAQIDKKFFLSIEQLEADPTRKLDLKRLSREVGMSLSSYAHKFKDIVGIPPAEYAALLRLEQVRRQLEHTNLSIFEIAAANGFSSDNYLIRIFKKRYGITPKKFRMLCQCSAKPV